MLFELRQYAIRPGKQAEWVRLMEEEIIPFQVAHGMVVLGSFVGQQEDDLYVWIRRFESEEEYTALCKAVYESDTWKNVISPKVGELLYREKIVVYRLVPTAKSVIH